MLLGPAMRMLFLRRLEDLCVQWHARRYMLYPYEERAKYNLVLKLKLQALP